MFSRQKNRLKQAVLAHRLALKTRDDAREKVRRQRHEFLGEPLNLLYPFSAGILVCASQLKNDATGLQRIPFLNLAKIAIGVWATVERIRKVRKIQEAPVNPRNPPV